MLWKAGCLTALVGLLLSLGSCFFFGTAARKASAERQVAEVEVEVGRRNQTRILKVDPGKPARVDVMVVLELPEEKVQEPRERAEILQLAVPVNYEVISVAEDLVHLGAGEAGCSTIVPEASSPHFGSFDPRVECTLPGQSFMPPESGHLWVDIEVSGEDSRGVPVREARVRLFDQLEEGAGAWAATGALSFFIGPVVLGIGVILFLIGLLLATGKKSSGPSRLHPPMTQ